MKKAIVWFRNDLRLHDHEPLVTALQQAETIVPVYVWDSRLGGKTAFGFPKLGVPRAIFLQESIEDLHVNLTKLGSGLVFRVGLPEILLPEIALLHHIEAIFYHAEATYEEITVERKLAKALAKTGIALHSYWGHTLYNPDELPFAPAQLPDLFTAYRRAVEERVVVRKTLPTPRRIPTEDLPKSDAYPTPAPGNTDSRQMFQFTGGETAGKARLAAYIWQGDHLKNYKLTRNGLLTLDCSSKFSPWLALGCLSPRFIYEEVQHYEREVVRNESTYWLVFELLWRDYFRLLSVKEGNKLFQTGGIQQLPIEWRQDWALFTAWQEGRTGYPLVDAAMQELMATGYTSNRARQNAASFLVKNLGVDWRMGAEWFESHLIDYDVCSNWGNWCYMAGVGNDARGFRYFNILKQSMDYDPAGDYVRHWLPALAGLPAERVHQPWLLTPAEQVRYGIRPGSDYPLPIVDLERSVRENEVNYRLAQQDPMAHKGNFKLRRAVRRLKR